MASSGPSFYTRLGRHIVPQLISPVVMAFSLDVGAKNLATAGLSFLGLGSQPPTADWGSIRATGRQFVILSPRVGLLRGFAIFVIVLALNLVGDAPRDLLGPRTYSRRRLPRKRGPRRIQR